MGEEIKCGKGILQQIEEHTEYINMNPTKAEWKKMWDDFLKESLRSDRLPRKMQMTISKSFLEHLNDDEFVSLMKCDWLEIMMGGEAMIYLNERCELLHDKIYPPKREKKKTVQSSTKLYNHKQPWKKSWKR